MDWTLSKSWWKTSLLQVLVKLAPKFKTSLSIPLWKNTTTPNEIDALKKYQVFFLVIRFTVSVQPNVIISRLWNLSNMKKLKFIILVFSYIAIRNIKISIVNLKFSTADIYTYKHTLNTPAQLGTLLCSLIFKREDTSLQKK